jgi:spoIIIJ-associated protein
MKDPISYAKKYLEDLLSFFGLNIDVSATQEDEVIDLSVPSTHLNGFLIGQRGDTLRSIQFLVSTALKNQEFEQTRVNVDIADYKRHRRERLAQKVEVWIEEIKTSKEPRHLYPMNPADRRVVHKTVAESRGVTSESEGEARDRHVVITPVTDEKEPEEA